jgi:ribose transport system substrate-binding protein
MSKKTVIFALMIIMALSIPFTGQSFAKSKVTIGFVVMDLANPFYVQETDGFKAQAKKQGSVIYTVDGKMDAATQVTAIENFIAQKVNVIVCSPVDSKAIEPLVKKAQQAGIKFIAANQEITGYDAFITVPELQYGLAGGRMAGEWMTNHFKGEVEVAILDLPELKQIIDRAKGLEQGILEKYPKAKVVAHQSASTPETGMKAAETILQAHPNVKVISCINDAGALGAAEAAKAMGKASSDFCVFGLDATPEALAKIKENGIYRGTIDINPKGMGGIIFNTAYSLAVGKTLKEKVIAVPMIPVTQK